MALIELLYRTPEWTSAGEAWTDVGGVGVRDAVRPRSVRDLRRVGYFSQIHTRVLELQKIGRAVGVQPSVRSVRRARGRAPGARRGAAESQHDSISADRHAAKNISHHALTAVDRVECIVGALVPLPSTLSLPERASTLSLTYS